MNIFKSHCSQVKFPVDTMAVSALIILKQGTVLISVPCQGLKIKEDKVNEWNNLPQQIVSTNNVNSFKYELDSHWKRYGF